MAKFLGAKIGDYHTLNDWGLYLKVGSPKIGAAEVDEYLVQVTGSDTLLNLTAWDDGKVHYKKRTITMELLCNAPKSKWPSIESTIANAMYALAKIKHPVHSLFPTRWGRRAQTTSIRVSIHTVWMRPGPMPSTDAAVPCSPPPTMCTSSAVWPEKGGFEP